MNISVRDSLFPTTKPTDILDILIEEDCKAEADYRKEDEKYLATVHPDMRHMMRRMFREGQRQRPLTQRSCKTIADTIARAAEGWHAELALTDLRYLKQVMEHRLREGLDALTQRGRIDWHELVLYTKSKIDYKDGKIVSVTFSDDKGNSYVHKLDSYMSGCTRLVRAMATHWTRHVFCDVRFRVSFVQRVPTSVFIKMEI